MSADSDMVERLQSLASALGAGGLNETDPAKLLARVEWGVDHIQQIEAARSAQVVEELSKQPRTTRDEVKKAIPARVALDASGIGELEWLAENPALELSWGEIGNDPSECAWRVHRRQGGHNDREWALVATGDTPLAALSHARATVENEDG